MPENRLSLSFGAASIILGAVTASGWLLLSPRIQVRWPIFIVVIILSFFMMQKLVGLFDLHALAIPSFFFWMYVAIIVVPAFFVYGEERDPFRGTYLLAVESALLTVPFGVLVVNLFLRFEKRELVKYFQKPIQIEEADSHLGLVCYLVLALAIVLSVVHVMQMVEIPLFFLVENPGSYAELTQLREESLKLLDSPLRYAYSLLGNLVYPFLILVFFGQCLAKRKVRGLLIFLCTLAAGLLYAALTIARSPVASIVLLLFIFHYLYEGGRVRFKTAAVFPILYFAFPVFVNVFQSPGMGLGIFGAVRALAGRIFYTPAKVLYYYFEVFPHVIPFQHGRTIGKMSLLLGFQPIEAANIVGRYITHGRWSSISANAAFLGNLNADFGLPGVFFGGVLAGAIMQLAQIYLVRRPKTVLNLSIYGFSMFAFSLLVQTGLPVVLVSNGALLVFVLGWIIRTLAFIVRGRAGAPMPQFAPPTHTIGQTLSRSRPN